MLLAYAEKSHTEISVYIRSLSKDHYLSLFKNVTQVKSLICLNIIIEHSGKQKFRDA